MLPGGPSLNNRDEEAHCDGRRGSGAAAAASVARMMSMRVRTVDDLGTIDAEAEEDEEDDHEEEHESQQVAVPRDKFARGDGGSTTCTDGMGGGEAGGKVRHAATRLRHSAPRAQATHSTGAV